MKALINNSLLLIVLVSFALFLSFVSCTDSENEDDSDDSSSGNKTDDDDSDSCIYCASTSECVDAFGKGWGCVGGCCENMPSDDDDNNNDSSSDDDDNDDDNDDDDDDDDDDNDNDDDDDDDDDDNDNDDDNNDDDDDNDNDDDNNDDDDPEMMFLFHSNSTGSSSIYKRLSNGNWFPYTLPTIQGTNPLLFELDFPQPNLGFSVGRYSPSSLPCFQGLLLKYNGSSWSDITMNNVPQSGWIAWESSFIDENHGFVVGSEFYCYDEDWPVVLQYDNGSWNNITPSHFSNIIPFFSVLALSDNSFIAVGRNYNGSGYEDNEGAAYLWDSGIWSNIIIDTTQLTQPWYLSKIFHVPEGDLEGIYSIGEQGYPPNQIGLLFKYNELLLTFEHLYSFTETGSFDGAAYGDSIISIVGYNQLDKGIFGLWNGNSFINTQVPLVGISTQYKATQVINANDIWVTGWYQPDASSKSGLIHRFQNDIFEVIETPNISDNFWFINDFIILQ